MGDDLYQVVEYGIGCFEIVGEVFDCVIDYVVMFVFGCWGVS